MTLLVPPFPPRQSRTTGLDHFINPFLPMRCSVWPRLLCNWLSHPINCFVDRGIRVTNQSISDSKVLLLIDNSSSGNFQGRHVPWLSQDEVFTGRHELDNVSLSPHMSQREPRSPPPSFGQGDDLVALVFWVRLAMVGSKSRLCYFSAQVDYITKINPSAPLLHFHSGK